MAKISIKVEQSTKNMIKNLPEWVGRLVSENQAWDRIHQELCQVAIGEIYKGECEKFRRPNGDIVYRLPLLGRVIEHTFPEGETTADQREIYFLKYVTEQLKRKDF